MSFDAKVWAIIIGLAAITFLIRWSFLGLLAGRQLPGWATEALGFVPVTVLPALVAPMLLLAPEGGFAAPERWLAGAAALAVGLGTRSFFAGFVAGLAAYHLAGAIL